MESLTVEEETGLPQSSTHGLLQRICEHWGWVVTFGVTVIWFLIFGSQFVYAITLLKLQEYFNGSITLLGLIGSIYITLGCCLSPVTAVLQRRFSHRTITVSAILITSVSYILSSFMDSLINLFFTFGVLSGIAYNLIYTSLTHILVCYFPSKKYRAAISIAHLGPTLALFSLSPLIEKLLTLYGWRWTLRIQGLIICVGGLLACIVLKKPPIWKKGEKEKEASKKRHKGQLMAVLKLPEIWIFNLSTFLTGVPSTFQYVFMGSYVVSKGLSNEQSATGMMVIGCGSLAACCISAVITDRISFPIMYLVPVLHVMAASTFVIMTFVQTFIPVLIICAVIGLLRSGYAVLLVPPVVELLGTSRALEATTVVMANIGIGCFVGSYILGTLFDAFGSYDIALYICAGIYLVAATLALMAPLYQRCFAPDRYLVDKKPTHVRDVDVLSSVQCEYLLIEERESVI